MRAVRDHCPLTEPKGSTAWINGISYLWVSVHLQFSLPISDNWKMRYGLYWKTGSEDSSKL